MEIAAGVATPNIASKTAEDRPRSVTKIAVSTGPADAVNGADASNTVKFGEPSKYLNDQQTDAARRAFSIWLEDEPKWQRRATLPPPKQPTPAGFNVWALIKDFVGKGDLSKMATPVQYLEPLSELQQRCEDLEYSELLDQAAASEPQSLDRLLLVTAFSVSAYSGVMRTQKPINALLGETFEYSCPEKGFRFLAEKVQAEPTTINHVHVEGRSWTFNLEDELHVTFTGTSIDLKPIVLIRVVFADGDTYTWHKAVTSIQGVLTNNIKLEHKGAYTVQGCQSGCTAKMKLHASGMFTSKSKLHEVSGTVEKDGSAMKDLRLKGKWDVELIADMPDGSSKRLWEKKPPAADPSRFAMTSWVMTLNEVSPELERLLPPTDTRLRADIRAVENGIYDQAEKEHKRLRDEDDAKVKGLVKQKMTFEPRWCERIPDGNLQIGKQYLFQYKGCYWEERAAKAKA